MLIQIPPSINNNGPINFYRIIVQFVDGLIQNFDEHLLKDYRESQENGLSYYIAAEIKYKDEPINFTVGDGQMYQGYNNVPLPSNSHAHISIGVVSTLDGITKYRYTAITSHEQHNHLLVFDKEVEEGEILFFIIQLTL